MEIKYRKYISVLLLTIASSAFGAGGSIELPVMFENVGRAHGVPPKLLLAIGLTESYWSKKAKKHPWPWTLNIEGAGRYYETKDELLADLSEALFEGRRSIDFGMMQINLRYHHRRFNKITDMLYPVDNLNTAAIILLENRETCGGDWWCAVGAYHSSTPKRAEKYIERVKVWMDRII